MNWFCWVRGDHSLGPIAMDELLLAGSLGTSASLTLRLGQTIFSSASLLFMSFGVEFYSYTAFCYLVTVMGLVLPWSFTLAMVDAYSLCAKCPLRQPGILWIIIMGDWNKNSNTSLLHCTGLINFSASSSLLYGCGDRSLAPEWRKLLSTKVLQQVPIFCCNGFLILDFDCRFITFQSLDNSLLVIINYVFLMALFSTYKNLTV
ncbi:hypothetical protein MKW94_001121 [Papaver nudicaule]|uniref:CASP-like protein n=1 Tax=Papaver nudicaule TaxID=74823 RepID=A0AA41VFG2_PAPNU|nr:hypothetical protein [Papaver nudicaule]